MTYGEAIYQLTNFEGTYETPSLEAIELAIEILEKQIPKKPINETGYYRDNKCPSCLKPIKSGKGSSSHYRNNWCNNCGQHIDWSEV